MKKFVKSLFKKDEPQATLENPSELLIGDIIMLDNGFDLPKALRGQKFEVKEIQTYQFEHQPQTSFVLQGSQDIVFLNVEQSDGETLLNFSIEIERDEVGQLFDLDQFSDIFDSEDPAALTTVSTPEAYEFWLAEDYRQTAKGLRAYYYPADYRKKTIPAFEGEGEPIDYYCLESADRRSLIEIEVRGDGYTEVCLVIVRPQADIRELWPGQQWSKSKSSSA